MGGSSSPPPPRHDRASRPQQLITQPQPPWISDAWACLWDWIQGRWNAIQVAEARVEGALEIKNFPRIYGGYGSMGREALEVGSDYLFSSLTRCPLCLLPQPLPSYSSPFWFCPVSHRNPFHFLVGKSTVRFLAPGPLVSSSPQRILQVGVPVPTSLCLG